MSSSPPSPPTPPPPPPRGRRAGAPPAKRSLQSALIVLDHPEVLPTSSWTRAVAVLGRRALEVGLDDLWRTISPGMTRVSRRAQFICLGYFIDRSTAGDTYDAWSRLSGACHHHVVDLPPTDDELRSWLGAVDRFLVAVSGAMAVGR